MTSTLRARPSTNGGAQRARAAASSPPRTPVRRRWGRIGAGVATAVLGAWIFAALYLSAGDRVEVLVVANDVEHMQVIDRSDLRVVRLSETSEVSTVPASRMDEFVGRVAGVDQVSGSVLTESQVLASGTQLVSDEEAVVGLLVGPADAPQGSLRRGTPVLVVLRPATGSQGPTTEVEGWAWDVSEDVSSTRDVAVEVVIPADASAQVSAAAAERLVSIVVLGA